MQCLGMENMFTNTYLKKKVKIIYRGFVHKNPMDLYALRGNGEHYPKSYIR